MKTIEIMSVIENQSIQLERAQAVLAEIDKHFDDTVEPDTWQAALLIKQRDHIRLLFDVVNDLLYSIGPKLNESVKGLEEICRQEKEFRQQAKNNNVSGAGHIQKICE